MGIVSKKCGHCGQPVSIWLKVGDKCPHCGVVFDYERNASSGGYRSGTNWGLFFKILLAVCLAGSAIALPFLRGGRSRQYSVSAVRQQLASPNATERLKAGFKLARKPRPLASLLSADYVRAMRSGDPATRAKMIRNLEDVEKGLRQGKAVVHPPLLPQDLVSALEEARLDENSMVREAATEALAMITNP